MNTIRSSHRDPAKRRTYHPCCRLSKRSSIPARSRLRKATQVSVGDTGLTVALAGCPHNKYVSIIVARAVATALFGYRVASQGGAGSRCEPCAGVTTNDWGGLSSTNGLFVPIDFGETMFGLTSRLCLASLRKDTVTDISACQHSDTRRCRPRWILRCDGWLMHSRQMTRDGGTN